VPVRGQDQSEQEYVEEVSAWAVEYLDLDVDALKKRGLVSGTPEYLDFILQQADAVIQQIFSANPEALAEGESIEGLQAALKGLTTKEMEKLERALFVRGELGKLMGSGDYTDAFTGISERVEGDGMITGKAAYQRGIARSTDELANLRGADARSYLGEMLGRNPDLYGLQAGQDARMLRARLLASEMEGMTEEEKRRRMAELGGSGSGGWLQAFENADAQSEQLLGNIGSDGRGQAALLQAIFGE
jgi:hypothetical protein